MDIIELVNLATSKKASDIHISVGIPPVIRVDGKLIPIEGEVLKPADTKKLVYETLPERTIKELEEKGEVDTSFSSPGVGRYRVNAYKQRGSYGMALRIIPLEVPTMES